jgi:hypothetical protein
MTDDTRHWQQPVELSSLLAYCCCHPFLVITNKQESERSPPVIDLKKECSVENSSLKKSRMKSHRYVEGDGRRRRTVPILLLPFASFLSALLLQSSTVEAFQFGRIFGSSSSSSVARRSHNTIILFAQEGASDKDETNIHQSIASQDPTWYQQYVVDILGKEYTESNLLQMSLEVATSLSFPKMEEDRGVQKVQASTDEIDLAKARERAEEQSRRRRMVARLQAEKDMQDILQKSQAQRARQAAEEAQWQMEEQQKKLEARLQAEEQARLEAEEAKKTAEEQVKRLETRLKAEEAAKVAAEEAAEKARMLAEEANRKAEEEAEEEAKAAAAKARILADEAEEEAKAIAETARVQAEEAQKKTEEEQKAAAEKARILAGETKRKTEQQERAAAEKARVLTEEAKKKAELEAKRAQEMAKQAEEEAKQKAYKETNAAKAKSLAEEAKIRAGEEFKRLEALQNAQEQTQLVAEDAKKKAESKSPITTNTTSKVGPGSPPTTPSNTTANTIAESEERVAVFQDLGEKLKSIPLKDLLALGYRTEEIRALQADALAVIVNDEIKRPRVGVPPQWKISSNAPDRQRVQLVDNAEQAQGLVDSDQVERQRKRAATEPTKVRRPGPTQPSSSNDDTRGRDPPQASSENRPNTTGARERRPETAPRRRPVGSASDLDSTPKSDTEMADEDRPRRRRPLESEEEVPGALRARRRAPPTDEEGGPAEDLPPRRRRPPPPTTADDDGSRRRRRSSTRDDGTPKRIYSAREPNGARKPSRPQNPNDPPDSPIWMDMDTFRDMLRSEAELRLRVLGDDWAPTVKQESDWRLKLYKDWLWALHNGVGTNAVVPSSRYDRARKMGERRQREQGDEMPSSRPKRRPRRDDSPPESR